MSFYAEYTTIHNIRSRHLGNEETGEDEAYADLIQSTSRDMDGLTGRKFVPRVETLAYDTPDGRCLKFGNRDILEVVSLTNGDGTSIAASEYFLEPANDYPKTRLDLKASGTTAFQLSTAGDRQQALSLVAITAYHPAYAEAWASTLGVLAAAITDAAATTFTCTTGKLHAGDLIKIDSEWLYVVSVTVAASDTATVVRGVNGSTAATHLISATIYKWSNPTIEMICRTAVIAFQRVKNNPTGETLAVGGYQFITPKDVNKFVRNRLAALGLVRLT